MDLLKVSQKFFGPQTNDYNTYKKEIDYYRDYIQPMTNPDGNNLRHLAGSAAFAQKYGILPANIFGASKEFDDYFIKRKGLADSLGDLKNNALGSLIGASMKSLPRESLYNIIFNNYVRGK